MSKPKQTKAYKEAVKKMTAAVAALSNGAWQGSGTVSQPAPPTQPSKKPAR